MSDIEICLACDHSGDVAKQVKAAFAGGAIRVELCSQMAQEGLTPSFDAMVIAKAAAQKGQQLLSMIRPRGGDFCYDASDIQQMQRDIVLAAQAGMHGVVLGVLKQNNTLDMSNLKSLLALAEKSNLTVTFHRAFDALTEPEQAITTLIDLGVKRILTSGVAWGSSDKAVQHIDRLENYLKIANGNIEIVIGGGITASSARQISGQIARSAYYSFHAHSSALSHGSVHIDRVKELYQGVNDTWPPLDV
jgi:copper homeostasis protein